MDKGDRCEASGTPAGHRIDQEGMRHAEAVGRFPAFARWVAALYPEKPGEAAVTVNRPA